MYQLDDNDLKKVLDLIHSLTGITIDASKKSMVAGRVRPLLKARELDNLEEYMRLLKRDPEETQKFVDRVTTNETSFFRTPRVWAYIKEKFLPEWLENNPGKTLKIWSAASSTGEEVYTLGMVCSDFQQKNPGFNYQIVASDINAEVLQKAKNGVYSGRNIDWIGQRQPEEFKKYFIAEGDGNYKIAPAARKGISFCRHNLFEKFSYPAQFDLVFLRNVLIYFSAPDQEKVLAGVHAKLKNGGCLVIGESEALNRLKTDFHFVAPLIYQRKG